MAGLRTNVPLNVFLIHFLPGLALGVLVGAIAQFNTFCSVGAVADVVLANDWRRARSWIMAGAVALIGTQIVAVGGLVVPIYKSVYRAPFANPLMATLGSIAFGYGMAMAGGCLQRALVRIGGGSLRSLATVAIMAASGQLTIFAMNSSGIWDATALKAGTPSSLDGIIATTLKLNPFIAEAAVTLIVAAGLIVFCLKDSWFRKSPGYLWGGVAIGTAVVLAWLDSSRTGGALPRGMNFLVDLLYTVGEFNPSTDTSSFVYPAFPAIGRAAIMGAVLIGVILGSFAVAVARRDITVDRFADQEDVMRHVVGGILMGIGGAMAYGCTFGQGLSGFSTLSITSFIAIAAMIAGCVWGIRALEAGSAWGGLKLCFGRKAS